MSGQPEWKKYQVKENPEESADPKAVAALAKRRGDIAFYNDREEARPGDRKTAISSVEAKLDKVLRPGGRRRRRKTAKKAGRRRRTAKRV